MSVRSVIAGIAFCLLLAPGVAGSQAPEERQPDGPSRPAMRAVISGPSDIAVGRTIVLDASRSRVAGDAVSYEWFVGDAAQPISRAVEAIYTPERAGTLVFRLRIHTLIDGKRQTVEADPYAVVAYSRKVLLFADAAASSEKIEAHRAAAEANGVYLHVLQAPPLAVPFTTEEMLSSFLAEHSDGFVGASAVVVWTEGISGLQALMQLSQQSPDVAAVLKDQTIVILTDGAFQTIGRTIQGAFAVLSPRQIVITRPAALQPLLSSQNTRTLLDDLNRQDIDFLRVDSSSFVFRPWNALSYVINYMLREGVSSQVVLLLLVLPVIATILAFFKQVVGIATFGLYTPSIIALSFLALGWRIGIIFLLFIILTGYATRSLVRHLRLLYIPKVAIVLTVVSLTLLLLLGAGAYFGMSFSRDTVFILLIMSTLAESFLNLKREEGLYSAIMGIGETLLASLICVAIAQWGAFQTLLLAYPEIVLGTIVINVLLGRWTGLRLLEYWRFREVFRHLQEE